MNMHVDQIPRQRISPGEYKAPPPKKNLASGAKGINLSP
jgi:hypothetical protein